MERPLSIEERVMWLTHQVGCANCSFTANVSGKLDESALRTALDLLAWRHPLLSTRIEVRGQTPFFVSKDVPQIPLRVSTRRDDEQWQSEVETELNDSISMSAGPLLRAVLLKSDEGSDVLLTFHHLIADGKSGINLITELLQLTGQISCGNLSPEITRLTEHPPLEQILPADVRGVGGMLKAASFITRQLSTIVTQRQDKLPPDSDAPSQACRARFVQRRLSHHETGLLRARSRKEGTTVQGAVCAAILKAAAKQIQKSRSHAGTITLTCASAVDLRPTLEYPIKDEVGNFASIAVTAHKIHPATAFWKLAATVRDDLDRAIARSEPAVSLGLLKKFLPREIKPAELVKKITKFNSPLMATNLGVITMPDRFGPITVSGLHVAVSMTAFPTNITIVIGTYRDQLELNFCYSEPNVSRQRVTKLVEDGIGLLRAASAAELVAA